MKQRKRGYQQDRRTQCVVLERSCRGREWNLSRRTNSSQVTHLSVFSPFVDRIMLLVFPSNVVACPSCRCPIDVAHIGAAILRDNAQISVKLMLTRLGCQAGRDLTIYVAMHTDHSVCHLTASPSWQLPLTRWV
jgi:hypothetical protein